MKRAGRRGGGSDFSAALAYAERNPAVRISPATKPRNAVAPVAAAAALVPDTKQDKNQDSDPDKRRSKTEVAYEKRLRALGYEPKYEPLRLEMPGPAKRRRYKPDFLIVDGGEPYLIEVKGRMGDGHLARARLLFEMAVKEWNWLFGFVWVRRAGGEWTEERIEPGANAK